MFKVWRRPYALDTNLPTDPHSDKAAREPSLVKGDRLWLGDQDERVHGEAHLDEVAPAFNIRYSWAGLQSNTVDSLRLVLWAQEEHGKNEELMAALGWRHFSHDMLLSDHDVLLDACEEAGLDREEARGVLRSNRYREETLRSFKEWQSPDQSIPRFHFRSTNPVVDHVTYISGSQPVEVFEKVLRRLESEEFEPPLEPCPALWRVDAPMVWVRDSPSLQGKQLGAKRRGNFVNVHGRRGQWLRLAKDSSGFNNASQRWMLTEHPEHGVLAEPWDAHGPLPMDGERKAPPTPGLDRDGLAGLLRSATN